MRKQTGFTLIEIAIVLVIIGLLLGGILKGQELITGAKVRNLISQVDGVKAAFFGFQDRYRAYPGDYSQAVANIANVTAAGNGNGRVEAIGIAATPEELLVWDHLSHAGFITGTYSATSTTAAAGAGTNPANPYNVLIQLVYDNVYADAGGSPVARHNVKTGNQIPVEIISEVDRKVDDGNANTGGFRGSLYIPGGVQSTVRCWNTTSGAWLTTIGEPDCGGASLF
jgi:prepilin-type N-terminal cleavage/methylation domain-containing protein